MNLTEDLDSVLSHRRERILEPSSHLARAMLASIQQRLQGCICTMASEGTIHEGLALVVEARCADHPNTSTPRSAGGRALASHKAKLLDEQQCKHQGNKHKDNSAEVASLSENMIRNDLTRSIL
ncbi:hypothetical protein [Corallococcus sp. Z5C101001]|uniref:hypothetical protein n=1 Tax=Corallococcus sp. Z5C101001 TaxID=2596829 RepID=UPI00163D941F|nr:hypothetical protein [Corallococcus sp. Z5C101001]